jgi:hypothetical protein
VFDHPLIQVYQFEDVPLNRDLKILAVEWAAEFEAAMIKSFDSGDTAYTVGYYSAVAAREIRPDFIELTWYPNTYDRFHQVRIVLPRTEFVTCVGSWQYDYDPIIIARSEWLNSLHLRSNSVFAFVDAVNAKNAIASGFLTRADLIMLQKRIDAIADANPTVAFMSFGDSLMLKSNYKIGMYNSEVKYSYEPEKILRLLPDIRAAYKEEIGLDVYVVVTQGSNEYYDDDLLHISESQNHISFNSLGLPFAQLLAIEQSARAAGKSGIHPFADIYLDESFYHSLRFKSGFNKNEGARFPYVAPMASGVSEYFPMSFKLLEEKLE